MKRRAVAALAALLINAWTQCAWSAEPRSISAPMGAPARRDSLLDPNAPRYLSFSPSPLARCENYIVFEAAAAQVNVEGQDWLDDHLVRNSLGWMKNVSSHRSLGGSLDLWWMRGTVAAAPTVRARQWFGERQSVEASAGWVLNNMDGAAGPIGCLRYSPTPLVFVEAGACGVRTEWWFWDTNAGVLRSGYERETHAFAGLGLTGGGGLVVFAGEALTVALLIAVLAGASN